MYTTPCRIENASSTAPAGRNHDLENIKEDFSETGRRIRVEEK